MRDPDQLSGSASNQRFNSLPENLPDTEVDLADFTQSIIEENQRLRSQIEELKRSQTSAHYNEASYRSIFDNAAEGKYQCLPDGRFLKINVALTAMLGYETPEELTRDDSPSKNQFFAELHRREEFENLLSEQGEILEYEYQIKKKDGQQIWVSENARIVKDARGTPLHVEGTIQDISERKHVEEMVQQNEQRLRRQNRTLARLTRRRSITHENLEKELREIVSSTAQTLSVERVSIWLFNEDQSRLRCDCLYQKNYDEFSQGLIFHIDDFPNYFAALKQERVIAAPCATTDPRLKDLGETYLEPNGICSMLAAPIKGGGEFVGMVVVEHLGLSRVWTLDEQNFVGSIADIVSLALESAERNRVEEALRVTDERFQILVRATNESIWDWDFQKDRIWWNEGVKTLFGFKTEDVRDDSEWRFSNIHPEDRERVETEINYIIDEGGQFWSGEYRHQRADGTYAHVMDRGFILHNRYGQPIRMIGSIMDITARKAAEQALKEERAQLAKRVEERTAELSAANSALAKASKLKDEFLASMSHELRTPLNAVLGMSEALLEQVYGELNERQMRFIHNIDESGRHLLSLINDILDLSKIEVGKLELELGNVAINPVCQSCIRMVKEAANQKRLKIKTDIDTEISEIVGDERRLKQILVNLLSNAVKFTPEEGDIGLEVSMSRDGSSVLFSVWDSGIGISKENIGRLFKPFTQLDGRLSRQYNGTGLGLALARRMVELHGGSIKVESTPGNGSRFTFNVPWKEESAGQDDPGALESARPSFNRPGPARPEEKPPPIVTQESIENNALILVAEDNEINVESLTEYLLIKGFRVIVARDGAKAVQMAKENDPDLILMDVQMPEMDGLEATQLIRANSQTASIPIVALTALAMPGDRERCLAAGANVYVSKPVNMKNLILTINQLLQKTVA